MAGRSTHATLCYAYYTSRVWYCRITGEADNTLHSYLQATSHQHAQSDNEHPLPTKNDVVLGLRNQWSLWVKLMEALTDADLQGCVEFRDSNSENISKAMRSLIVSHVFNENAFYRGQITSALIEVGVQPPRIDMWTFLPTEVNCIP